MAVKLSPNLIEDSPPKLADLAAGAEGFLSFAAVQVDLDRSVYLSTLCDLRTKGDTETVKVMRDEQGRYHLDLQGRKHRYRPQDLELLRRHGLLVPVESLTE
ncbi:MAG: hypothetical protein JOY54_11075 [Acidobacteriaceae bacterium]|nr:hypothetical protein [Acidobacteriaceae bacterium]